MSWPTFKYVPVDAVVEKLQRRQVRTARKDMLRFFTEKGFYDFATRLRNIKINSRLNGATKRTQFDNVLQDYIHETSHGATPPALPEASSASEVGNVGVQSA